jgi:hypothetical protein
MCQYFEISFVYGYYTLLDEWALENQRLISVLPRSCRKLGEPALNLKQAQLFRRSPNSGGPRAALKPSAISAPGGAGNQQMWLDPVMEPLAPLAPLVAERLSS